MKRKIEPLDEVLKIVQASGEILKILGTVRIYLTGKETLISLNLLRKMEYDMKVYLIM